MAPVIHLLANTPNITSLVCNTGQHQAILNQVLSLFQIRPDYQLQVMSPNQHLNTLSGCLLTEIDQVLAQEKPDRVLVHGDTTTAAMGAMAAFHRRIPVAHIEAGLRTYQLDQPFPEEYNRRCIDIASDLLLAPTEHAALQLKQEKLQGRIIVTGNTIIDSLQKITHQLKHTPALQQQFKHTFSFLDPSRKLLLVTAHRRENQGQHIHQLCEALKHLTHVASVQVIFTVHPNPNTHTVVHQLLDAQTHIHLLPPQDYLHFVYLMQQSDFIITDSGGIQEEATALNKKLLIWRAVTERQELLHEANTCYLQNNPTTLIDTILAQLPHIKTHADMPMNTLVGDGHAAARIVSALQSQTFPQPSAATASL